MKSLVLVDSNIYIGLLRRRRDPVAILGQWIGDGDLATCGMVRLEVERGLKVIALRQRLAAFFDVMCNGVTSNETWEQSAELAWTLDRSGKTLPAQDILIAVTARLLGAVVLTDDGHFSEIPDLPVLNPVGVLPGW